MEGREGRGGKGGRGGEGREGGRGRFGGMRNGGMGVSDLAAWRNGEPA